MSSAGNEGPRPEGPAPALVAALAAFAVVLAALVGWLARRGLDHSDEGYYLNAAAHPLADRGGLLQFGHVYHWLLLAVGTDVAAFRVSGLVLTVALGAALCWVALDTPALRPGREAPTRRARAVTSLAVGLTGLFVVVQLPLTPSYNTLALQALLLTATGLLLATRGGRWAAVGWGVVGAGGWLALLAKPTTAAALAVLVVLVTVAVPGRWHRQLPWALAGVVATAVATLGALGQSPREFVEVIRTGLTVSVALDEHSDLLRWDPLPTSPRVWVPVVAVTAGALALTWVAARAPTWVAAPVLLAVTGGATYATARWWSADPVARTVREALSATLVVVGVGVVVTVAAGLLLRARPGTVRGSQRAEHAEPAEEPVRPAGPDRAAVRARAGLVLFLLALPVAFAFGTNQNLWTTACRAVVVWLVVLAVHLRTVQPRLAAAPVLAVLVLLTATLGLNVKAPYRYEPLRSATTPAEIGPLGGTLLLTPADAARAARVNTLADRLGIGPDTGILDLTGDSPGWIFRLGGRPVGQTWVIGGYPGSRAAASVLLRSDPCVLGGALLLVDRTAPRAIAPSVLHDVGLDLERDYHLGGSFERTRNPWRGAPGEDGAPIRVYVPNAGVTVPGCAPTAG